VAPIFPLASPIQTQPVRSVGWNVHQVMNWSNMVHRSANGGRLAVPLYPNNPLWSWEFTYGYIKDDPNDVLAANVPYTDLQILKAFYFMQKGAGFEFLYKPWDAVVVGQPLAAVDANNNTELVHTIGAVPNPGGGFYATQNESVQELNGLTPTVKVGGTPTSISLLSPGSTPPYEGYVVHFSSAPGAAITADFTYYYRVAFTDDTQDYEYYMYTLAQLSSLKFEQVRVTV
jgi:hypothetical protein